MEWWHVLLIVIILLALVYIIGLLIDVFSAFYFLKKMRNRKVAISAIFVEKRDILILLAQLFAKDGIPLDADSIRLAISLEDISSTILDEKKIVETSQALSDLYKRLSILSAKKGKSIKNPEYFEYLATYKDLNAAQRRIVTLYNTELGAYEYWRSSLLYVPFTMLFGLRKKERIN